MTQTTKALRTRYRANVVSPRITISTDVVIDATVTVRRTSLRDPDGTRRRDGNGDADAQCLVNTPELAFYLRSPRKWVCGFARCVRSHAAAVRARSAWMRPTPRRQLRRSRGVSRTLPHERVEGLSVPSGRHHLCRAHGQEASKMAQQRFITSLVVVLAFACAANAGFAQTQATTINGAQTSGDQDQSAAAHGPGGSQSVLQSLADANAAEQQLDGHAARDPEIGCRATWCFSR